MKWNRLLLTSILAILLLFLGACSNANEKEEATNEETEQRKHQNKLQKQRRNLVEI